MTNSKMAQYAYLQYHSRMAEARTLLGAKCSTCNSLENLEFDHIDPKTKVAEISSLTMVSKDRFLEELEKCQLLCRVCHQTKSLQEKGIASARTTHGTLSSYRYCKCELCKDAMKTYNLSRATSRVTSVKTKEIQHGTESTYNYRKCRCDNCKEAHRLKVQKDRMPNKI